ncbi:MAG: S41 family peptidase, partial [Phycisphaerales bacterium]|nr:S41 family peptidase [Phycisphaerales bacterium]
VMTASAIRFHWVLMAAVMLLPGLAWGQNAGSKTSPFEQLRWVNDQPEVFVQSEWYRPVAIEGVQVKEILDFCTRQWPGLMKKRFGEDLPEALELMGQPLPRKVTLALVRLSDGQAVELKGIAMSAANRRAILQANRQDASIPQRPIRRRNSGKPPTTISHAQALEDIEEFQRRLDDQFAYRHLRGIDLDAELDALRNSLQEMERHQNFVVSEHLAAQLNVVLAKFGDGHASASHRSVMRPTFHPPFLMQDAEGGVVAFLPDRSGFLDNQRPFILAIDGVPIDDWIDTVRPDITSGSPQLVRTRALRGLRDVELLRVRRGLPGGKTTRTTGPQPGKSLRCTLATGPNDPEPIDVEVPMTVDRPTYGSWPRSVSTVTDDKIGYLRLAQMDRSNVWDIRAAMEAFQDTDGLIVDVRGNGGGTRQGLITLAGYLLGPDEQPWVGNVAKYRLSRQFDKDHLEARYMYRQDDPRWTDSQRAAIAAFAEDFQPEWDPGEGFSDWHYLVLDRSDDPAEFFYDKPVIILSDPVCFSATDIFLGALADRPRITLMGKASGGGSARSQGFTLSNSGVEVRCASMASFRPDGRTYDGRGIEVDIEIDPAPDDVLQGSGDRVLEAAIERIRSNSTPGP